MTESPTINLVTLLESDLRALSAQASSKRHSDIRASCARALALLGSAATPAVTTAAVLHPLLLVLRPLTRATADRALARMQAPAASCLNKVVANGELTPARLAAVVAALLRLCPDVPPLTGKGSRGSDGSGGDSSDAVLMPAEDVCVKVLQTLAALLSEPRTAAVLHGRALGQAFAVALRLYARGTPAVRTTAASTLPVMLSVVLQGAAAEHDASVAAAAAAAAAAEEEEKAKKAKEGDKKEDKEEEEEEGEEDGKEQKPLSPEEFAAKAAAAAAAAGAAAAKQHQQQQQQQQEEEKKDDNDDDGDIVEGDARACCGTAVEDACAVLRDMCSLTRGEKPAALAVSAVDVCLALQMLEYAVQQHPRLFVECQPVRALLVREVCPAIIALFHGIAQFRLCAQLVRTAHAFIASFHTAFPDEAVVLFAKLCKLIDQDAAEGVDAGVAAAPASRRVSASAQAAAEAAAAATRQWQQALVLEVLRPILNDRDITFALYANSDARLQKVVHPSSLPPEEGDKDEEEDEGVEEEEEEEEETEEDTEDTEEETPRSSVDEGRREEQGIFAHALGCVARLVERCRPAVWAALTLADSTPAARTRLVEQHDAPAAPALRPTYVPSCALSCLLALVATLRVAAASAAASTDAPDAGLVGALVGGAWPALLAGLDAGLEHTTDEGVVAALAKAYETLVAVCGTLRLDAARDAFLASLVRFVLLPSAMATLPAPLTPAAYAAAVSAVPPAPAVALLAPLVAPRERAYASACECAGAVRRALVAKGLTAARTLMGLMHGAGNVLGASGWRLVLGALESLHRCAALLGVNAALPCDDNDSALTTLYECSCHLAPAALRTLLAALCALSDDLLVAHPRTEAAPPLLRAAVDPARNQSSPLVAALATYGARNAVLVAHLNADRCDVYWRPYAAFLVASINSPNADVRTILTASYGTILRAVLVREVHPSTTSASTSSSGNEEQEKQEEQEGEVVMVARCDPEYRSSEATLLAMQTTLFADGLRLLTTMTATDTHVRLLADVHRVLQAAGHRLTAAWPRVLAVLAAAAQLPDRAAVVAQAFQTVLLVSTDYLACLMAHDTDAHTQGSEDKEEDKEGSCMDQYIDVVALYAQQTDHMNISLSSEDVLWSVASFLAKTAAADAGAAATPTPLCAPLALHVMRVLQQLACDARADVRNSAITVLFRIVTSHTALCAHDVCLWDVLFPMLDRVQQHALAADADASASDATPAATATAQQWAQSVCLVFEGMGRVLRLAAEGDKDAAAPRFAAEWARTCAYVQACAEALHAPDVAECALTTLAALGARAVELRLARAAWDECLGAVRAVVAVVTARPPRTTTTGQTLAAFVRTWTALLVPLAQHEGEEGEEEKEEEEERKEPYLTETDVCAVCDIAAPLALLRIEDYTERDGQTPLQLAVGALLARAAAQGAARETVVAHVLRTYAACPARAAATLPDGTQARALSGVDELRCRAVGAFACAACAALGDTYSSRAAATDAVRVACAEPVVALLGTALASRPHGRRCDTSGSGSGTVAGLRRALWLAAARALVEVLPVAAATLAVAGTAEASDAWARVLDVTGTFLFGPEGTEEEEEQDKAEDEDESNSSDSSDRTEEETKEDEEVDVALVRAACECYLHHAADAAEDARFAAHDAAAVALFARGAHAAAVEDRTALCEACYHALFALASVDAARPALVAVAAPAVLARALAVLAAYARDSACAAGVLETRCVLRECAALRTALPNSAHAALAHCPLAQSPQKHLIVLFPRLCELVALPAMDVKPELAALLQLAGTTFFSWDDAGSTTDSTQ